MSASLRPPEAWDADLLLLAGRLVLGRDLHDAVGVDVERDLDLRLAARCRWQTDQVELAEHLVLGGDFALALEHADGHGRLVVVGGGEGLALLGRDRRVALDQAREHAAQRLDAERQRRDVEQQDVLDLALQHGGLNCRTDRHDFVGIDVASGFLAEELLNDLDHLGHAGHAADQDNLVDLTGLQAGVLERGLAGLKRALHQVFDQSLELGARQLDHEMLGAARVGGDERQVDLGLLGIGEFDLGLLGRFLQALQGKLVVAQVDALLFFELVGKVADDADVKVLATQEGVAVGRLDLEHAVADLEDRHVERAAAQIVDRDGAGLALVHAIGQRRRGRLVDDAQDFKARDAAGVFGRLPLGIVEVGRDRNDRLLDLFAEIGFGSFLHLAEDECRNLAGAVGLPRSLDPGIAVGGLHDLEGDERHLLLDHRVLEAPPDHALDGIKGFERIGDGLPLGGLADKAFARICKCDHGRRSARALRILDNLGLAAFHDRDARIGRAEVDTDDFRHVATLSLGGSVRPQRRQIDPRSVISCRKTGSG